MVQLRVQTGGEDILVYSMRSVAEAADMVLFLRDFLPEARFVLEPLLH